MAKGYQRSSAGNVFVYDLTRLFIFAYHHLGGLRVIGRENIPRTGRAILAPNHISHLDPPIISSCSPRRPHVIAKKELFKNKLIGKYFGGLGAFPVDRGKADRKAIRRAIDALEKDELLLVFPEGTRSPDGELRPAEIGLGMIAHAAKAPIIPVFIKGTKEAFSPERPGFRLVKTEIYYGEPLLFEAEYSRRGDRATLESIGTQTMKAIAALRRKSEANP